MTDIEPGTEEWEVARNRATLRWCTPEIRLTPANEALKADFISGMEKALFGADSTALTIEATDTTDNFRLGHAKMLARVAFLHLEEAALANVRRPFDLAIGVRTLHLSIDMLSEISDEELRQFEYDSFDGVTVDLLDTTLKNYVHKSLHHNSRDSRYDFQFYEHGGGYAYIPGQTEGILESAYQIGTGYWGTPRTPRLGTHLQELQVIVDVLKNGTFDQAPASNFLRASEDGDSIRFVPLEAAKRVTPYMHGMFKQAVEAPDLRDEIARHQYFHVHQPDYLNR